MSIVVLDGPDGTGKTTLAKRLLELRPGKYLHQGYKFKDNIFLYHTGALRLATLWSNDNLVILDRLWLSECLYARAFRGGTPWPHEGRFIERVLLKHAAMTVVCLPNENHVVEFDRLKSKRREEFTETLTVDKLFSDTYGGRHVRLARDYAEETMDNGGLNAWPDVLSYKIGDNLDKFCAKVFDKLDELLFSQFQPALDPRETNILGHAGLAKFLFVGDVSNSKYKNPGWPFYEYGNCSLHLTKTLSKLNFDEHLGLWVNINELNGINLVDLLLKKYDLVPIVFGNYARDTFKNLNKDYHLVSHPQFARRFHANDNYYVDQLGEILCR